MRLTLTLLTAVVGSLALAGAAQADMAGVVGNTIVVTTPQNATVKVMLRAEGTYQTEASGGPSASGTWAVQGDQICYTQSNPAPAAGQPQPFCVQGLDGHKVGDSWSAAGMAMTVVAGQ